MVRRPREYFNGDYCAIVKCTWQVSTVHFRCAQINKTRRLLAVRCRLRANVSRPYGTAIQLKINRFFHSDTVLLKFAWSMSLSFFFPPTPTPSHPFFSVANVHFHCRALSPCHVVVTSSCTIRVSMVRALYMSYGVSRSNYYYYYCQHMAQRFSL